MESYEQKYKAALEWMQGMYGGLHGKTKEEAGHFFPELKESKDEWIRKTIIRFFKDQYSNETEMYDGSVTVGKAIAWLEKQGQEKHLSESTKDYQGSFTCWNNAHDFRPKHLQRCICYDKYMGGVYCYVYDDISKYWCTQTTEEHDSDGDNHICDYADYRITVWMPLPDTSFYPSKFLLEKQGKQKQEEIDQKCEPFRIKKGEWYVCIHDFCNKAIRIGEIIQAEHDDTIRGIGFLYMENKYFRPAFENEIPQKPKWTDEDEERLQSCIIALQGKGLMGGVDTMDSKWLKSLKQRMEGQQ